MDKSGETVDRSEGRAKLTDIESLGKALGLITLPWFQPELFSVPMRYSQPPHTHVAIIASHHRLPL